MRESEERFRYAMEATSDGLWDWNVESGETYFSPAYYRMLGYEPGEFPGLAQSWTNLIHPEDREHVLRANQDCIENRIPNFKAEFRMRHKSGGWKWILGRGKAALRDINGHARRMVGTHEDIAERKQLEEALNESEARYRTLFDSTNDSIFIHDMGRRFLEVNKMFCELLGYSREELLQMTPADISSPEYAPLVASRIVETRQVGHAFFESAYVRRDGAIIPIELSTRIIDYQGKEAVLSIARDITERKVMEDELGRLSQFRESIIDNANIWLDVLDEKANVVIWNKAAEAISGYSREEVVGQGKIWQWLYPDEKYRTHITGLVADVIQKGTVEEGFETTIRRKDGQTRIISWNERNLLDEHGKAIGSVALGRDVTERKRIELALRERMKELSCLYGVARSVEGSGNNLDAIMGEVVSIIPPAYAYPDIACARIVIDNQIFESAGFKESRWCQSADITMLGNVAGRVEVYYLQEKPTAFEGPFLKEERDLINTIAERLGRVVERKRVQDALHESEERYRDLFENSTDLIQSVDNDGRFEYVNAKWLEALGYTREETKQLTLMDILRKDQVPHCNELFERARNGEALDHVETVFVSKDGREIIVEGNVNGQFKNGQFVATRAIFTDITERKKADEALRESENRYRTLFDSTNDAIFIHDMGGKFLEVNQVACERLGYSREELSRMTPPDINSPEHAATVPQRIEELRKVGHSLSEIAQVSRNGTIIPTELSSRIIDYKGKPAVLSIARDITERKQMERMKDQFVSTVSHELRTPLTSIRASLGLLASGVSGTLPEKGQRMLEIAVTNTDRLVRLINDILDSERLASGKTPMEKKTCNAAQLVTQAADVMKPMAEKAGISLSVQSQNAALWADPDRIVQALTNLIGNAIKFSPRGGKIWVTAERKENQMLFRVQDEGRGIPSDKLGLLFERFQQVDASDAREKGGTGLGLSISKSIVEQHNGKVWVESTVGKGSTFFFTLPPLQQVEALPQPEASISEMIIEEALAQRTRRVLIIEDDSDLASTLTTMLQRHDIQPHTVQTAKNGIALAKQMHPDLIVLDLGLPDMDGSAVVQALREHNNLRFAPLVVYTVRELNEQQRENLRLGETLFFTKSRIPPDQFEEKVVQFMKRIIEKRGKASVS